MTSERTQQFIDVLESIFQIGQHNLSVEDATRFAYFEIAKSYKITPNTVESMFRRPAGEREKPINAEEVYYLIKLLFSGNSIAFSNKYCRFIPDGYHGKVKSICEKFKTSACKPPDKSDPSSLKLFRQIRMNNLFEKHTFFAAIDYLIKKRLGNGAV